MVEKYITRKINLQENDGLSEFLGIPCQQNENVFSVFFKFLNDVKPSRILEIGTALGGFTNFLNWSSKKIEHPIIIRSYDVAGYYTTQRLINDGIDIRLENIFDESYTEINQEVINYIQGEGTTIIICDGGNKIAEFNLLSKYLKYNDFIMVHDYAKNIDIFNKNISGKIWNWFEISDDDIKYTCNQNNLIEFEKELFESVAWTCRKKIS